MLSPASFDPEVHLAIRDVMKPQADKSSPKSVQDRAGVCVCVGGGGGGGQWGTVAAVLTFLTIGPLFKFYNSSPLTN